MNALLVATIQVSAILAIALGLVWLLNKRTASLRHAVITIALACAAIVPVLDAFLPAWPRTVLPAFSQNPGIAQAALPPRYVVPAGTASVLPTASQGSNPSLEVSAPVPAPPGWQISLPAALELALGVYLAGVGVSLATLAFGLLRLRWISARTEPMTDCHWQRRLTAIAFALRLRRRVYLARSSLPLLATWGFLHPQVLLPAGAEHWPEDRIRAVLLHELAHIRRNDWLIQVLAGILRAFYWFNPLVWMALARLRQESEQACDDVAIQQGEDEIGYAGQLLTLARMLNGASIQRFAAAPSMALRSTLKRRISVVVDPATSHAPANATSVAAAAAGLLALTCVIAGCSQQHSSSPEISTMQTQALAASTEDPPPSTTVRADSDPSASPDTQPEDKVETAAMVATPVAAPREPDEGKQMEPRSPAVIVAGILELMQTTLADESLAALDEIARPITGLHHVQRYAQAVVDAGAENPASAAANHAEIINALINTANFASNITSTARGAGLPKRKVDQLAARMRDLATELAEAAMPTPGITSVNVSTPERRLAISALDLAQTTLRDTEFVGPPSSSWMHTELSVLERAAQSVLSDSGASPESFNTKLHVFNGALRSATRSASDVTRRPRAPADIKDKATRLVASIRRIMNQLEAAMRRDEQYSDSHNVTREISP